MDTLLRDSGFWVAAGVSLAVVAVLALVRALSGRWWSGAGLAAALGALVGLATAELLPLPLALVGGIVALGIAAQLATRWALLAGVLPAAVGAVLVGVAVGEAADAAPQWARIATGTVAGVAALLVGDLEDARPRLLGVCLAVSAVSVYVAVPDTESVRPLVGAAGAAALLSLPRDIAANAAGSAAALGLLAWSVGVGGWPRPGAVVGGLACVGVLVLGRVIRWARTPIVALLLAHVAVVAIVARIAGLRERAVVAGLIVASAFAAAVVALLVTGRPRPRGRARAE
jgi:hypothetical protein